MIDKTSGAAIDSMLAQIRQYEAKAKTPATPDQIARPLAKIPFPKVVQDAVRNVNATQMASKEMAAAYERGEEIPLTDVVLAMQKSSLAFEATLQIRNKVLKAYEDIMNMPV